MKIKLRKLLNSKGIAEVTGISEDHIYWTLNRGDMSLLTPSEKVKLKGALEEIGPALNTFYNTFYNKTKKIKK